MASIKKFFPSILKTSVLNLISALLFFFLAKLIVVSKRNDFRYTSFVCAVSLVIEAVMFV